MGVSLFSLPFSLCRVRQPGAAPGVVNQTSLLPLLLRGAVPGGWHQMVLASMHCTRPNLIVTKFLRFLQFFILTLFVLFVDAVLDSSFPRYGTFDQTTHSHSGSSQDSLHRALLEELSPYSLLVPFFPKICLSTLQQPHLEREDILPYSTLPSN